MERTGSSLKRSRRATTSTSHPAPAPQYPKPSKGIFRRNSTSHPTTPPSPPLRPSHPTHSKLDLTDSHTINPNDNASTLRGSAFSRPFTHSVDEPHSSTPPPHLNTQNPGVGAGQTTSEQLRQLLEEFEAGKLVHDIRIPFSGKDGLAYGNLSSGSGSGSGSGSLVSVSDVGSGNGDEEGIGGGDPGGHGRESTYEKVRESFERGLPSSVLGSSMFTSLIKRTKGERKGKSKERQFHGGGEGEGERNSGGIRKSGITEMEDGVPVPVQRFRGKTPDAAPGRGGGDGGQQTLNAPPRVEEGRDSSSSLAQSSLAQYSILSRPPPRTSTSHLIGGAGPSDTNYNPFLGLRSTAEQDPAVEYHADVGVGNFGVGDADIGHGRGRGNGDEEDMIQREVRLAIPSLTMPSSVHGSQYVPQTAAIIDGPVGRITGYPTASYEIPAFTQNQFPQRMATAGSTNMGAATAMAMPTARPPRQQHGPRIPPFTKTTTTTTIPVVDMPVPPPVLPIPEPPEPQANTNHHHKSSRSKTRHHKSSSHPTSGTSGGGTGTSVSNLILYTTTRLSEETARANAAERQMGESLAIVRNAVKEREEVKMRLGTVQEELRMYKRELEIAQQEILRAQEVLAKVERERLDAENRATRDRAKLRKLLEEKAIRKAIEEGRRMGFEQGLETGRQMAWEDEEWYRRGRTRRRPNWMTEEETSGEYPRWSPTATATSVGNHASTSKATTAQIGPPTRASSVPPVQPTRSESIPPPPISAPAAYVQTMPNPEPPRAPPPPVDPPQQQQYQQPQRPSPTPPQPIPVQPTVIPIVQIGPAGYPIPPLPVITSMKPNSRKSDGTGTPSTRSSKSRPLPQPPVAPPPRPASAAPMTSTSSSSSSSSRPTVYHNRGRSDPVGIYAPYASTSTAVQGVGRPRSSSASMVQPPPPVEHMDMPEPVLMPVATSTSNRSVTPERINVRPSHGRGRSGSGSVKGKEVVRERYDPVEPGDHIIPPPYGLTAPPALPSQPVTNHYLERIRTPSPGLGQFEREKPSHKHRVRDGHSSRRHQNPPEQSVYPSALPVPFYGGKAVTTSTTSTRLSQLDIVSPPRFDRDSSSQKTTGSGRRTGSRAGKRSLGRVEEGTESRTSEDIAKDWRAGRSSESPSPMPMSREDGRRRGVDMIYNGVVSTSNGQPTVASPRFAPTQNVIPPHVRGIDQNESPNRPTSSLVRSDSQRTRRSSVQRNSGGDEYGIEVEAPSRPASEAEAAAEDLRLLSPDAPYTPLPAEPVVDTPTTPTAPPYQEFQGPLPHYEFVPDTPTQKPEYPVYPIAQPSFPPSPGKENMGAITGFVPDIKSFPSGFVPLSPIPALSNISSLPAPVSARNSPKGGFDVGLEPVKTMSTLDVDTKPARNAGRGRKGVRGKV